MDRLIELAPVIGGWMGFIMVGVSLLFIVAVLISGGIQSLRNRWNVRRFDRELKEMLNESTNTDFEIGEAIQE